MVKTSSCWNTTSSNCVTNEGTHKDEFANQTEINDDLFQRVEDLEAKTDTSNLQTTGTEITSQYSLVDIIQVLINNMKANGTAVIEVNGETIQVDIDLKCLAGNCDSGSYNLNRVLQIFAQEICNLRQKVVQLENQLI